MPWLNMVAPGLLGGHRQIGFTGLGAGVGLPVAYVNLAGDGGGDQGGAAFLKESDL